MAPESVIMAFDPVLFDMARNDDYAGIYREIARRMAAGGWRPIETAPRDGTEIFAAESWVHPHDGLTWNHYPAAWKDGGWATGDDPVDPSHWMPIPPVE
jgi:hypothetical protein